MLLMQMPKSYLLEAQLCFIAQYTPIAEMYACSYCNDDIIIGLM